MIEHFAALYEQLAQSKGIGGVVERILRSDKPNHIDNRTVRFKMIEGITVRLREAGSWNRPKS